MKVSRFVPSLLAILATVLLVLGVSTINTHWLDQYGWVLFFLTPAVAGAIAVLIANRQGTLSGWQATVVALQTGLMALCGFLVFGLEGTGCLLMALPIILPLFMVGGATGLLLSRLLRSRKRIDVAALIAAALLPLLSGFEAVLRPASPVRATKTSIIIEATPEALWEELTTFSRIPEPEHWIFKLGIAYPIEARLEGRGVGAIRYCQFNTGAFIEPVTAWEPGKRLAFDVLEQPLTMREVSFYQNLHPPHTDWAFQSHRGQFLIRELDDGRLELEGTTWHTTTMQPEAYWGRVSEFIVHRIHQRVLGHIKIQAEEKI